ncbi:MAG TPA: ABC transporter permease subunit [Candidatus Melainabacteria bacterium]|nr:ABC transporter permease subunit [Candidatus Melainabacteria bacterium]
MNDFLHDLLVVVRKELLYIFRVPDVLIFSVFIPMVLYPVLMIAAGIYSAWAVTNQKTQIYKIAIPEQPQANVKRVVEILKATGRVVIVPVKNPDDAVRKETVTASISSDVQTGAVEIHYDESSFQSAEPIRFFADTLESEEKKQMTKTLVGHGLSKEELEPLDVRLRDISAMQSTSKFPQLDARFAETYAPLLRFGTLLGIFFLLSNARSSAVSPAVFMLAQERDLKTLKATLSLPISWNTLILGKAIAVSLMALLSVFVNSIGVIVLAFFVTTSLLIRLPSVRSTIDGIIQSISPASVALIATCSLLDILLSSCTLLLLCSLSRTTKEAQSILLISSLGMVGVSIFALAPDQALTWQTALIPIMNLLLVIKAVSTGTHTPLPVFITIAENMLLIYVAVHLTAFRLGQESFILAGETHFRWPWQRRTKSVQSKSN